MLNEVGDIWAEKENNLPKAIETLEEALELKPDNHVLLHKLLGLYQKTRNYDRMIDTIQTISDLDSNPERKARYLYTMAQLHRDQNDLGRAVELFNACLFYTSDAADDLLCVDIGGRRIIKKKKSSKPILISHNDTVLSY